MAQWNMLYDMYERRLKAELSDAAVPAHIGVILDGNRRWAKSLGATASQGHRAGAGKISEFLQWSDDAGVSIVTLWLLSTDNLSREAGELGELLRIICEAVSLLADQGRWKLAVVGDLSLLPDKVAEDLRASVARTADVQGMTVNIAGGYGGRDGGNEGEGGAPGWVLFHVIERDEETTRAGGRNLVLVKTKRAIDVFADAVIGWPVRDRCCLQYEACERPSHT